MGHFVQKCCDKDIPYSEDYRNALWGIIEPLTHDPDKDYILDPAGEDVRTCSFVDHSINNPRGNGLHGLFKYARWVADHVKEKRASSASEVHGTEVPGAVSAACDAAREMAIALLILATIGTPLLIFAAAFFLWKIGRAAWLFAA